MIALSHSCFLNAELTKEQVWSPRDCHNIFNFRKSVENLARPTCFSQCVSELNEIFMELDKNVLDETIVSRLTSEAYEFYLHIFSGVYTSLYTFFKNYGAYLDSLYLSNRDKYYDQKKAIDSSLSLIENSLLKLTYSHRAAYELKPAKRDYVLEYLKWAAEFGSILAIYEMEEISPGSLKILSSARQKAYRFSLTYSHCYTVQKRFKYCG